MTASPLHGSCTARPGWQVATRHWCHRAGSVSCQLLIGGALATAVHAGGTGNGAPASGASAAAQAISAPLDGPGLVKRLQDSARLRSYSGTYVVTASGSMSSARIVHTWDGRNQIERVESLDGQMRRVFRYNDAVTVLWPASRSASIEPRGALHGFPDAMANDAAASLDMYEVQSGADDRIAGHDAQTVTLRPRDNARFMQRWWLERQTGLLLRADVVNERGEVLESAAFSELQFGMRVPAQALLAEMTRLDGYRVNRSQIVNTDLEREGWSLVSPVAGFRPVQCVQRQAAGVFGRGASANAAAVAVSRAAASSAPAASGNEPGGGMLQAIYSDGLTHVSIFIEAYRPAAHVPEPVIAMGATHAIGQRHGDWWITVVGDVPPPTLRQFAQALERRKPATQ
jgi:sigma-E factor negative regulatory protein RseB